MFLVFPLYIFQNIFFIEYPLTTASLYSGFEVLIPQNFWNSKNETAVPVSMFGSVFQKINYFMMEVSIM